MTWLGETTANPVPNGYLIGTAIFGVLLVALVWAQIRAQRFNPWLYWATIVASTTCGTTLADFADRSLGIGYPGGSLLLLACVLLSLFAWHRTLGTHRRQHRRDARAPRPSTGSRSPSRRRSAPRSATGCARRARGLGYSGGALVFGAGAGGARDRSISRPKVSRVCLFWAAFILTRPLGATVGDFLDKPVAKGGLELSRPHRLGGARGRDHRC